MKYLRGRHWIYKLFATVLLSGLLLSGGGSNAIAPDLVVIPVTGSPNPSLVSFSCRWEPTIIGAGCWGALQVVGNYSFQRVTSPVRNGTYAARIEVRPGDPLVSAGQRAEVLRPTDGSGGYSGLQESEISGTKYYAFSVLLPTDWSTAGGSDGYWATILQLHGPDALNVSPAFAFETRGFGQQAGQQYGVQLCTGDILRPGGCYTFVDLTDGSLNLGHWTDFVLGITYAKDASGSVNIWRRNEGQVQFIKVLSINNTPTLQYSSAVSGGAVAPHYWKMGLYRNASSPLTNVLYLGGFTRADTLDAAVGALDVPGLQISGNAGVAGATLNYTDGGAKTATSAADGSYSFAVPFGWSGTVSPSKAGYTFTPPGKTYTVNQTTADLLGQDYVASAPNAQVFIQGSPIGSYAVNSGGQVHPNYPGVFDGAVRVASTDASNIFASERQIYGSSFSESMGIPGNRLTTEYWFPWYDGMTMNTWITVGAPSSNLGVANVQMYINGALKGTYSVSPGSQVHPSYPGAFDGPVHVVSTNAQTIFASERQIYGGSFSETMGIPSNQLDTEYWLPLYDALTMRTWISIGAPDTNVGDATVEVYIAGTLMGTYTVAPGGQAHPIYPGTLDGPVRVVSTNGQQIFVSERQIYGSSFSESLGVPLSQLTTEYYFPWYDGMTMSTAISLGAPSNNTGPASVDLYIGGVYQNTYTVPSGGRASAIYPGTFNGAVDVRSTNSQNIFVSERQIYGSSFAETMAIAANQLTTEYWFPWYDGLTMRTWVSIGKP